MPPRAAGLIIAGLPGAPAVVKRSDFHFDLPTALIAQAPLSERSASRLLALDARLGSWQDRGFRDLPELLRAGDLRHTQ